MERRLFIASRTGLQVTLDGIPSSRMFPFFPNIRWSALIPQTRRMEPFRYFLQVDRPICIFRVLVANT